MALGAWGVGCALLGRWFIGVWVGPAAQPEPLVMYGLSALAVLQGMLLIPGRVVTALGAVRVTALTGLLNAATNICVSLVLVHVVGALGVALGTIVGYLLAGGITVWHATRLVGGLEKRTS